MLACLWERIFRWRVVPLAVFVVVPVLILRVKILFVAPDATLYWPEFALGDVRSWWKAVFIVASGLWMLATIGCGVVAGWRPRYRIFAVLLLGAAAATVVSAVLSKYPRTSWLGYTTHYEGAAVLLAYLVAAWYAAEMLDALEMRSLRGMGSNRRPPSSGANGEKRAPRKR